MEVLDVHVVGTALHRQRALPRRRQHLDRVQRLADLLHQAQPGQAGTSDHDRV
jgi:hypothetical protein